jgi:hypothetical protein
MERKSSSVSNLRSLAHLPPGCRFFSGIDTTDAETFVVVVLVVVECFTIGNHPTIALVSGHIRQALIPLDSILFTAID